jgi:hypothetical protein
MRCTLALCVALALGGSAWSAEQAAGAVGSVTQTPSVTTPAGVIQAPMINSSGANQTTTTSLTGTVPMTATTTTMAPGTYAAGTQPVTTYSTPTYAPVYYRGGLRGRFFRIFQPMNATNTMAATPAYGPQYVTYSTVPTQPTFAPIVQTTYTPVTTYAPATTYTPSQVTYMPARRGLFGLGLFQGRRRQMAYPMYTTAAPMTTGYATPATQPASAATAASVPATTSPTTTTPTYTETQYTAPATSTPANSLPSTTTPSTTTPPAPPIPQTRTPR